MMKSHISTVSEFRPNLNVPRHTRVLRAVGTLGTESRLSRTPTAGEAVTFGKRRVGVAVVGLMAAAGSIIGIPWAWDQMNSGQSTHDRLEECVEGVEGRDITLVYDPTAERTNVPAEVRSEVEACRDNDFDPQAALEDLGRK